MNIYPEYFALITVCMYAAQGLGQTTVYTDTHELTRYYSQTSNFDNAVKFCSSEGAILPKLNSIALKSAIADIVRGKQSLQHWIGATDRDSEGHWKWLDGAEINEANWSDGEPNNAGWNGEDCAAIRSSSNWNDMSCSGNLGRICQKSISSSEEISSGIHWCTFYRRDSERVDFSTAANKCKQFGGRLAEARTSGTETAVTGKSYSYFTDSGKNEYYWVGGRYVTQSSKWLWSSGSEVSRGWRKDEPNGASGIYCLASSQSGWTSLPCTKRLPYVCEKVEVNNIVVSPDTAEAGKGSNLVSCTADGVPTPDVFWYFGPNAVSNHFNSFVYQTKEIGGANLHFANSRITNEGSYKCRATNTVKTYPKWESHTVRLKVPSFPVIDNVSANSCNSSFVIRWTPSNRALGVRHGIEVKGDNFTHESNSTSNDVKPSLHIVTSLSDTSLYNISITPCPDECKSEYTFTVDDVLSGGLPNKVRKVDVINGSDLKCVVNWSTPVLALKTSIIRYQVTISEKVAESKSEILQEKPKTTNYSATENSTWIFQGKPNRKYSFGLRAQTCAGFGLMVWSDKLCITEMRAPDTVPTPQAASLVSKDDKIKLKVIIPSQINGPISCLFVIVSIKSDERSLSRNITLNDLKQMQINESKTEEIAVEYIAAAIHVSSLTKNETVVYLGDENETSCDVYAHTSKRQRRSENTMSAGMITGRNVKLDLQKHYEIAVVSTTPRSLDVLLKTSNILDLDRVDDDNLTTNGTNGFDIVPIICGVVGVLLITFLVAVFAWRKKRTKDVKNQAVEEENQTQSTEVIYQNFAFVLNQNKKSDTSIGMMDLEQVFGGMKMNESAMFIEEFQKLVREALSSIGPTEIASNPEFKKKNRYKNILPYDNSRVKIQNSDSGYINACYVDGYQQKHKFIATQGPLATTSVDFWLMVVEQNCTVIVMLARCFEAAKKKCEKYWPDPGTSQRFGPVTVTNQEEIRFCGFVQRKFCVACNFQEQKTVLNVYQFHFTKWPDHGVPLTTSHLTRMHKEVMDANRRAATSSPIIVHCSAGAGRTGAFIGYDIVLEESKKQTVDIYKCVLNMRRQRVDMVQNCDQYILIHKLLLEHYLFGDTDVVADDVSQKFVNEKYRNTVAAPQFKNLLRVGPMETVVKNTKEGTSPRDRMKVKLYQRSENDQELIVDGTFLESYDEALKLIALNGPTDETVETFWKVVLQYNVPVIVSLQPTPGHSMKFAQPWFFEINTPVQCNEVKISLLGETTTDYFTRRVLVVKGYDNTVEVTQLQLLERTKNPTKSSQFIGIVDEVQRLLRGQQCPVALIHSSEGIGSAETFCAVLNLIERLKVEQRVDIFRTVKDLSECAHVTMPSLDEYILCHQAVIDYLKSFDVYANFR